MVSNLVRFNALLLMYISLTYGMENQGNTAQKPPTVQLDIFKRFDSEQFIPISPRLNALFSTAEGRQDLVLMRVAEVSHQLAAQSLPLPNLIIVASSRYYDDAGIQLMHYSSKSKTDTLPECMTALFIIAQGIKILERGCIEDYGYYPIFSEIDNTQRVKSFDNTRVHDLYLLYTMILKNEIKIENVNSFAAMFKVNDEHWPPRKYSKFVHPLSAWQVIIAAIEAAKT